jgi:hypothetical protein
LQRQGRRVTPVSRVVTNTCELLASRLQHLEARIQDADETAWPLFLDTAKVLAALLPNVAPGSHGKLLTTAQMAERLGISSKTLLKRKARGEIRPALTLGARGRAAIRWRGDEAPNGNRSGNAARK